MRAGDKARATGQLGAIDPDAFRPCFTDWAVKPGDELTYVGPHPDLPGWELFTVEHDGRSYEVPAEPRHFEPSA